MQFSTDDKLRPGIYRAPPANSKPTPSANQILLDTFVRDHAGRPIAQVVQFSDGSMYARPFELNARHGSWVCFRGKDEMPQGLTCASAHPTGKEKT